MDLMDKQGAAAAPGAFARGASGTSPTEFTEMKSFFMHQVSKDDALKRELFSGYGDGDKVANFPLWAYLRANVRQGTDVFFRFGILPWTLMIVTFIVFMYLHY